jgi:hypothetical protein
VRKEAVAENGHPNQRKRFEDAVLLVLKMNKRP